MTCYPRPTFSSLRGFPIAIRLSPARFVGNLAALVLAVLLGAWGLDALASWAGYRLQALCWVLSPVVNFAAQIGAILCTVGILIWAFSLFKSRAGIVLMLGGVMLFILPQVFPHYLGVECLP